MEVYFTGSGVTKTRVIWITPEEILEIFIMSSCSWTELLKKTQLCVAFGDLQCSVQIIQQKYL
jgi:hypothetical protein